MPVFANYSAKAASAQGITPKNTTGGVGSFLRNSHPNVHVYPWKPQQATRAGLIRPELAQPHERSLSFSGATVKGSEAAKQIKSRTVSSVGCTSCKGRGGCGKC